MQLLHFFSDCWPCVTSSHLHLLFLPLFSPLHSPHAAQRSGIRPVWAENVEHATTGKNESTVRHLGAAASVHRRPAAPPLTGQIKRHSLLQRELAGTEIHPAAPSPKHTGHMCPINPPVLVQHGRDGKCVDGGVKGNLRWTSDAELCLEG